MRSHTEISGMPAPGAKIHADRGEAARGPPATSAGEREASGETSCASP